MEDALKIGKTSYGKLLRRHLNPDIFVLLFSFLLVHKGEIWFKTIKSIYGFV